jgi:AcrR family transcriptional regulator
MIHAAATPRERRHGNNLARITETAMRLVEEGGLEALSIHKLAAAVDYTPGALYRYFDSKDALLAALVMRVLEDVRAHVGEIAVETSALGRVAAMVHGYRTFARKEPRRFGLLAVSLADPRLLLVDAQTAGPVAAAAIAIMQPLATALADAERAGQLEAGDAAKRTLLLFGLMQGVLQLRKQSRFAPTGFDAGRLVVEGARALLVGWGGKPRAVDAAFEKWRET